MTGAFEERGFLDAPWNPAWVPEALEELYLDLAGWEETLHTSLNAPPAFAWPSDRSWCFASDVDPHYAGVGASEAAVRALLAAPGLDAVRAEPGRRQPTYS